MTTHGRQFLVAGIAAASALVLGTLVAPAAVADSGRARIQVQDRCDPTTFNAFGQAIGLGDICSKNGGVTFAEFAAALNLHDGGHDAWRFSRTDTHVDSGQALTITNEGGEAHSFTEVKAFGRNLVPPGAEALNNAVPETALAVPAENPGPTFMLPGGGRSVAGLSPGTHHFQCLIHPWMRTTVEVR
jgi:plastocyanin